MRIIALWLNPRSVGTHCVGHVGIVMLLKAVCCNGALVGFPYLQCLNASWKPGTVFAGSSTK